MWPEERENSSYDEDTVCKTVFSMLDQVCEAHYPHLCAAAGLKEQEGDSKLGLVAACLAWCTLNSLLRSDQISLPIAASQQKPLLHTIAEYCGATTVAAWTAGGGTVEEVEQMAMAIGSGKNDYIFENAADVIMEYRGDRVPDRKKLQKTLCFLAVDVVKNTEPALLQNIKPVSAVA